MNLLQAESVYIIEQRIPERKDDEKFTILFPDTYSDVDAMPGKGARNT